MMNNKDFAGLLSKAGAGRSSDQVKDVNEALTSWAKEKTKGGGVGGKKGGKRFSGGDDDEDDDDDDEDMPRRRFDQEDEEGEGKDGDKAKVIWKKGKKVARTGGSSAATSKSGEGGEYRDRAAERREGRNMDYDDEITRLVDMDVEKSKYLGGDLKHTHLVKGLDFALLTKVRSEIEQLKAKTEKEEEDEAGEKQRKKKSVEAVQTRTLLGKGVQFFLAQTYSEDFKPIDIFVHSAIEFDATLEGEEELPTMLLRSKAELEEEEKGPTMRYALPAALQQKLDRALANHRQGATGLKKKVKKRPRETKPELVSGASSTLSDGAGGTKPPAPTVTSKPKPMMEDIFAGAGKYVPVGAEVVAPPPPSAGAGGAKHGYFSGMGKGKDDDGDNGTSKEVEELLRKAAQVKEGKGEKEKKETPDLFGGSLKKKEGTALAQGTSYDDYYPDAGGGYDYDSDDGDRGKGKDKDGKKKEPVKKKPKPSG